MHPFEISVYLIFSYHVMVFPSTDFVASAARCLKQTRLQHVVPLEFWTFWRGCFYGKKKDLSIYTLSDLSVLSNLFGSLFLTIQKQPPNEWLMCKLTKVGDLQIFKRKNPSEKLDKIIGLMFLEVGEDYKVFKTIYFSRIFHRAEIRRNTFRCWLKCCNFHNPTRDNA